MFLNLIRLLRKKKEMSAGADESPLLDLTAVSADAGELHVKFHAPTICNVCDNAVVRWLFKSNEPPTLVAQIICEPGKYNVVRSNCAMPPGKAWPPGSYYAELLLDGRMVTTSNF